MNIKYYILSLLLLLTGTVSAQSVKFTASVSKNEVGTGEQFEITYAVNAEVQSFTPPNFSAFQLAGGPNQSSSMESVNGVTTVNTAFSYILVPVKEGDFIIGPAAITVNGKKLTSNSLHVKVVKGRPVQQNGGGAQGAAQRYDNLPKATASDLSKLLFLRAIVDKDNVYQGQQLTLTYRIYTRVGIDQTQVTKLPDLTGFWNEDVKVADPRKPTEWRTEIYKGQQYHTADIKQIILFPERAGSITIEPFEMDFVARVPTPVKDIMQQFFGGGEQVEKYHAKSVPTVVHVRALPETGKPDSFTGAVGKFNIDAVIDKTHVKANEALNYKITVTGAGNIKLLKNLSANFPSDFEKYDPKVTDTVNEKVTGVSGTRYYNYLLIPRHQGNFKIDPVKFSYFNPATGRYTSLETKAFEIKVDKGINETNVTAFSGADKQDVKLLDKDIHYIKTGDADLRRQDDPFYGSAVFIILLLLGPVSALIAYIYRNWNDRRNSDIVKVRNRKASKMAAKRLATAKKQLQAKNSAAFYEAIFKGLYGYLSDKLNISSADLNRENIAANLTAKGVNEVLIGQLLDTLDLCEMARYAPVTHISEQEVFEKAKNNISDIENEI